MLLMLSLGVRAAVKVCHQLLHWAVHSLQLASSAVAHAAAACHVCMGISFCQFGSTLTLSVQYLSCACDMLLCVC
jgi:hypothetical protein